MEYDQFNVITHIFYFILQDELLSSKIKKLKRQKKYRGESILPPELNINIPKPRYSNFILYLFYIIII